MTNDFHMYDPMPREPPGQEASHLAAPVFLQSGQFSSPSRISTPPGEIKGASRKVFGSSRGRKRLRRLVLRSEGRASFAHPLGGILVGRPEFFLPSKFLRTGARPSGWVVSGSSRGIKSLRGVVLPPEGRPSLRIHFSGVAKWSRHDRWSH